MNVKCNDWWVEAQDVGHMAIRSLIKDEILTMRSDQIRPVLMLDDKFDCIIPDRDRWLGEHRTYPPEDGIVCYTDGSKRDGLSGAGFFCELPRLEVSLSTGMLATVHQTELFAISELCCSGIMEAISNENIYICADSQSAIEALSSPIVDSNMVYEC